MRHRNAKYNSVKTEVDGIKFDSKKEAQRYIVLKQMEQDGEITDLQRQVEYELIPRLKEPDKIGKKGGLVKGKVIERKVSYVADFVYTDATGNTVVEDVKGYRHGQAYAVFTIKRKLMLWLNHIQIREI